MTLLLDGRKKIKCVYGTYISTSIQKIKTNCNLRHNTFSVSCCWIQRLAHSIGRISRKPESSIVSCVDSWLSTHISWRIDRSIYMYVYNIPSYVIKYWPHIYHTSVYIVYVRVLYVYQRRYAIMHAMHAYNNRESRCNATNKRTGLPVGKPERYASKNF